MLWALSWEGHPALHPDFFIWQRGWVIEVPAERTVRDSAGT